MAEAGRITPQTSPTSRPLRIKTVCDRWHPMTGERLPADVHSEDGSGATVP